jgi:sugar O-acyltransferase (sialic acid O-acetyltransferase NeuD family)
MARVVIFGSGRGADTAFRYLTRDSAHEIAAFAVEAAYINERMFHGLPVVEYESVTSAYPPDAFHMFVPLGFQRMNRFRAERYLDAKARGYRFISYVSSRRAAIEEPRIGENCFILEDNTIQPFASIGDNVVIWSGNHIGHHSVIQDHAFITSHVVLSGHSTVGQYSFLGVNATIKDQVTLAEGTLVGMGAIIAKDTEPWSLYRADATKPSKVSSADIDF